MKLHSVFLRKRCILPDRIESLREPFGDNWTLVEKMTAPDFDKVVRQEGWHFMWMRGSCSRRGFGLRQEDAANRALSRALSGVTKRFNAAELDSVQDTKHLGFHIASVTLLPRKLQQHTPLERGDETHSQANPER